MTDEQPKTDIKFIHLSRKDWLDWHYDPAKVSASEVAAIMGLDDWSSPIKRYHMKLGHIPRTEENRAMRLGHALEPIIAKEYELETKNETYDPGEYAVCVHPDLPGLFATLDRITYLKRRNDTTETDKAALELKSTGSYSRKEWEEEPPLKYQIQNQMQMACSGLELGVLAVLIGNQHFFHHDFMFHEELAEKLLKSVDAFLGRLKRKDPPDPTGHPDDNDMYKFLHPKDNGKTITANGMLEVIEERDQIKKDMEDLEIRLDEQNQKLKAAIGENSFLNAGHRSASFKHQNRKGSIKVKLDQLEKLEQSDIEFTVGKTAEFRTLRVKKGN